ncbi:MAG TPA: hypothetical protein VD966_06280, partial [Pyrinomonadaceae bacterium]|nr:hypothetical protein [Pyrinomonadaceae bacterium]
MTTKPTNEGGGSRKSESSGSSNTAAEAAPKSITNPTVAAAELGRFLALAHSDPHSILGAHPSPAGVI